MISRSKKYVNKTILLSSSYLSKKNKKICRPPPQRQNQSKINCRFQVILALSCSRPNVLQQSIPLSKSVERIISLSTRPDETTESIGDVFAGGTAVLVDLGDRDLDGCVVLGFDDTVGGRALAWDVEVDELSLIVFHFDGRLKKR